MNTHVVFLIHKPSTYVITAGRGLKQVFLLAALVSLTLYVDDHVDNNGIADFHDEFTSITSTASACTTSAPSTTSTTTMTTSTTSPAIQVRRPL